MGQRLGNLTADGGLSDIDAYQILQLSDGLGNASAQVLVAVEVEIRQFGPLADLIGEFAGEVVCVQADDGEFGHIIQERGNLSLELAAHDLKGAEFGQVCQRFRNLPFRSKRRAASEVSCGSKKINRILTKNGIITIYISFSPIFSISNY